MCQLELAFVFNLLQIAPRIFFNSSDSTMRTRIRCGSPNLSLSNIRNQ